MIISEEQQIILDNSQQYKQGIISVDIYDNKRMSDVVDLLEKGLVKEGRTSTVAPYRRFTITSQGKKVAKEYRNSLEQQMNAANRDASKMAKLLNY